MKLNEFLEEHAEWISHNVPGEYPYVSVAVDGEEVAASEFDSHEVSDDPRVTIGGTLISYPSE